MSETRPDPRPLIGEPLSLDLLNTRWVDGTPRDLLSDTAGLATWLRSAGLHRCVADDATLRAVRRARDALAAAVAGDGTALDEVLDHGRLRLCLRDGVPAEDVEAAPAHLPGWLAARDYLDLLRRGPDRIRACSGPSCVLHFYDTSKNGRRRWCSMTGCGNRAKAHRHYARTRPDRHGAPA
ncbi:CGNR zinc finger domain-containing protein [Actinosynnema sp. NPDC020468]|uniref:CGNR zinc finger domain-containing protein n=1 Tax=Actinosynnema sp. NPDC020468 TaxID=3154488 RepID=UPI0033F707A5